MNPLSQLLKMNNEIPRIAPRFKSDTYGETESTNHPLQPNSNGVHIFLGTPKTLTIHTKERLSIGSQFKLKNKILLVTEILADERSKPYRGLRFYELRFEIVS